MIEKAKDNRRCHNCGKSIPAGAYCIVLKGHYGKVCVCIDCCRTAAKMAQGQKEYKKENCKKNCKVCPIKDVCAEYGRYSIT